MKLLTIETADGGHPGVIVADGEVLDLARAPEAILRGGRQPASVRNILEGGKESLEELRGVVAAAEGRLDELRETGSVKALSDCRLLPPVPDPWLVFSVGMNYGRHLAEMGNTPAPEMPSGFIKTRDSLLGSGRAIPVPPQCPDMVDYEGELCFVFGRTCHNVGADEAMDYVAGYTIANDVSARNWIPDIRAGTPPFGPIHGWERNIMGKNLPGFTPCGPFVVTKDEVPDPHGLHLQTRLNGVVMQDTGTDDLIFGIAEIVSHFSRWYRFHPGDIVTTGSPSGVGVGRNPPVFMKSGDRIEIEIDGLGVLENTLEPA